MPRKQVYGKRSAHVYSNFAGFTSPVKPRKQPEAIEVVEVAEELERLKIHDAQSQESGQNLLPVRNPLAVRNANAVCSHGKSSVLQTKTESAKEHVKKSQSANSALKTPDNSKRAQLQLRSPLPLQHEQHQVIPDANSSAEVESHPQTADRDGDRTLAQQQLPDAPSTSRNVLSCKENPLPDLSTLRITNTFTSHVSSLLSLSSSPLSSFASWSDQLSSHFSVTKIAEASFGEVYRLSLLKPHPTLGRADESVLKIIALKPPKATMRKLGKAARKRIEMMSNPKDVASEVGLMQRMTTIPGYTMFRDCCVLQGRPGDSFVAAWRDWNDTQKNKGKEPSVFPDPGKKASYSNDGLSLRCKVSTLYTGDFPLHI